MKTLTLNVNKEFQLQKELAQFGLSPNDWKLLKLKNNTYKIQNKTCQDFYFQGITKLKQGQKVWGNITLLSL